MKLEFIFLFLLFAKSVFADSDIQCWGNNFNEQLNIPLNVRANRVVSAPMSVSVGPYATCIIDSNQKAHCWGMHRHEIAAIEALSGVRSMSFGLDFYLGYYASCAQTESGFACMNIPGPQPKLSIAATIVVGKFSACALDHSKVICWGKSNYNLPLLKNPKKIAMISNDLCMLDDEGVKCVADGDSDFSQISEPPQLDHATDLFMGMGYACATDTTGLHCWGDPKSDDLPDIPKIPNPKAPTQYVAGRSHICGLSQNKVECWGDNSLGQLNIPTLKNPRLLSSNYLANHTCALDDTGVVCWGQDEFGETSFPLYGAISAGNGNTCLLAFGEVQCWGKGTQKINSDILSNPKTGKKIDTFSQVAAGSNFACAMSQEDYYPGSCWGDSRQLNEFSYHMPLQGPFFLSAGYAHICYSGPDQLLCVGSNDFGQSKVPVHFKPSKAIVRSVASGGRHTCAIDNSSVVSCWGKNNFGQSAVPNDILNPRAIAAGYEHTCVLDSKGVRCWGRNDEGQSDVPLLKNPVKLEAGGYHTCAVDDEGVHCWGDNTFGQTNIPPTLGKNISSLTAGFLHSCAVKK